MEHRDCPMYWYCLICRVYLFIKKVYDYDIFRKISEIQFQFIFYGLPVLHHFSAILIIQRWKFRMGDFINDILCYLIHFHNSPIDITSPNIWLGHIQVICFNPATFIEMPAPKQESELSCTCLFLRLFY